MTSRCCSADAIACRTRACKVCASSSSSGVATACKVGVTAISKLIRAPVEHNTPRARRGAVKENPKDLDLNEKSRSRAELLLFRLLRVDLELLQDLGLMRHLRAAGGELVHRENIRDDVGIHFAAHRFRFVGRHGGVHAIEKNA